jgi:hypothetical protein
VSYTPDAISSLHIYIANPLFYLFLSCVNLLAVMIWSFSTDKFGRRIIINTCQTLVCLILFIVGALYWTGATTGNAAAGTGLVHLPVLRYLVLQSSRQFVLANMFLSWLFAASGPSWSRSSLCHTTSIRPNFPLPSSEASSPVDLLPFS